MVLLPVFPAAISCPFYFIFLFPFFYNGTNGLYWLQTGVEKVGIGELQFLGRLHRLSNSPQKSYFIFLIAIFRDLNDVNVLKSHNMALLLPAFSKILQKHIQVSGLIGWLPAHFESL